MRNLGVFDRSPHSGHGAWSNPVPARHVLKYFSHGTILLTWNTEEPYLFTGILLSFNKIPVAARTITVQVNRGFCLTLRTMHFFPPQIRHELQSKTLNPSVKVQTRLTIAFSGNMDIRLQPRPRCKQTCPLLLEHQTTQKVAAPLDVALPITKNTEVPQSSPALQGPTRARQNSKHFQNSSLEFRKLIRFHQHVIHIGVHLASFIQFNTDQMNLLLTNFKVHLTSVHGPPIPVHVGNARPNTFQQRSGTQKSRGVATPTRTVHRNPPREALTEVSDS